MTVKEIRELSNNIGTEYDDCFVVVSNDTDKVAVTQVRKVCSSMGKPCCVEIKLEK